MLEVGLVAGELVGDGAACVVPGAETVDDELSNSVALLTKVRLDTQNGLPSSILLRVKDAREAYDPPRLSNVRRRSCTRLAL